MIGKPSPIANSRFEIDAATMTGKVCDQKLRIPYFGNYLIVDFPIVLFLIYAKRNISAVGDRF